MKKTKKNLNMSTKKKVPGSKIYNEWRNSKFEDYFKKKEKNNYK